MGQRLTMMREPSGDGEIIRRWQEEIPNDGFLRYLDFLNSETLVPVSPKALAEILVHKTYDFIKPPQLIFGLGRILGVGVFLAEGEEHKVCHHFDHLHVLALISCCKSIEAAQEPQSRICFPPHKGVVSNLLEQVERAGQCLDLEY